MSGLMNCGVCCMVISCWGIIQLAIMGCLFYFEVPTYFEECAPHEYDDYDDLIKKTQANYYAVALNCWIASVAYILTLLLSYCCIVKARKNEERLAKLLEDDEYVCNPPDIKQKPKKK